MLYLLKYLFLFVFYTPSSIPEKHFVTINEGIILSIIASSFFFLLIFFLDFLRLESVFYRGEEKKFKK